MRASAFVSVGITVFTVDCATTEVGLTQRMPGGAASLSCAENLLRTLDYEVRTGDEGRWIQGEVRHVLGPAAAIRELIRVSRVDSDAPATSELEVQVRAWEYQPSMAPVPGRQQNVTETRPSVAVLDDGTAVLEECRGRSGS